MDSGYSSGRAGPTTTARLRKQPVDVDDIIEQTEKLRLSEPTRSSVLVRVVYPMLWTALSAFVRLYKIDASNQVVWDEAHFGKFGSHYLKHEFYFDVHPPLGKLLVGLSGWLAGYDGSFGFDSSHTYPDNVDYVVMRCFNCMFGVLCTPLAYKTALAAGYSTWTCNLIAASVVFEMISLVLSKFILLDLMLLFFTVLSYYCLVNVAALNRQNLLLTGKGLAWLFGTGAAIGCVCSVKWVGLFITALIGLYTVYDLLIKFYQTTTKRMAWTTYASHWVSRIASLIAVPFLIYLACFKIHFTVLSRSGPGDGLISTLLQASLEGTKIKQGPRSVAYGSLVTLRSQGLSPNLIHSHPHSYPEGSQQQQITTYGFKDDNNEFVFEFGLDFSSQGHFASLVEENSTYGPDHTTLIKNGDSVRLIHKALGCLLHSHAIGAPVSKSHNEVSCYANLDLSDEKDEWVVEIQTHELSPVAEFHNEAADELHPISTNFRLKHKVLGCYLATTGYSLPAWGYNQGEVVCKSSLLAKDKSTWWNIEDHANPALPQPTTRYVPPKPRFWKEFILLNYGMMASNNALIPDPDKFDKLSSEWWEWPILHLGLRMCGWGASTIKYFMMGHPLVTWGSTASLAICLVILFVKACLWQRQVIDLPVLGASWHQLLVQALFPLVGWFLHYLPFVIMGRVTYLHHYAPALYFAIFVMGYVVETFTRRMPRHVTSVVYVLLHVAIFAIFYKYRELVLGMDRSSREYKHLKLLESWMV